MKKLMISIIIIIPLLLICLIVFNQKGKDTYPKIINLKDNFDIKPILNKYGINELNIQEYYNTNSKTIFLISLKDIELNDKTNSITLKDYLNYKKNIDNVIDMITSNLIYDKTINNEFTIYKSNNKENSGITLIKCHTNDGNKDLYIGRENLVINSEIEKNICKKIYNAF